MSRHEDWSYMNDKVEIKRHKRLEALQEKKDAMTGTTDKRAAAVEQILFWAELRDPALAVEKVREHRRACLTALPDDLLRQEWRIQKTLSDHKHQLDIALEAL